MRHNPQHYLTPVEAALKLRTNVVKILQLIKSGTICTIKLDGRLRIPTKWLNAWLEGAVDDWGEPSIVQQRDDEEHEAAVKAFLKSKESA